MPEAVAAEGPFNLVVSARAIHHLSAEKMKSFYAEIYGIIEPDGAFFNLDTASPAGSTSTRRSERRAGANLVRSGPTESAPSMTCCRTTRTRRSPVIWSG